MDNMLTWFYSVELYPVFGSSTVTVSKLVWAIIAVITTWRAFRAYHDAFFDLLAVRQGVRPSVDKRLEIALGSERLMRGIGLSVLCMDAIGILALISPLSPPDLPLSLPHTPMTLGIGPMSVLLQLSLLYALDSIVRSRQRWRSMWVQRDDVTYTERKVRPN